MKGKIWASLALGLLVAVGCGGGGRNNAPTGKVCDPVYDPLPVELNATNDPGKPVKLSFEAGANGITQYPGTYTYENAEIYYSNSATGVKLHLADNFDKREKQYKFSFVCVAGMKPNSEPIHFEATGISKMEVEAAKVASFGIRNYILQFRNTEFPQRKAEDGDSSQFDKPSKVYDGNVNEYFLYKAAGKNDINFETRSRKVIGDEKLDVVIRYKRTPPKKVENQETVSE